MPKLRVLSGNEVLKILRMFGFEALARRGSHIHEIDRGTLHAIVRQACR